MFLPTFVTVDKSRSRQGAEQSFVPQARNTPKEKTLMPQFKVHSEYSPAGDQPQAIEKLAQGVDLGLREQVLKGVTGSGKTYTRRSSSV